METNKIKNLPVGKNVKFFTGTQAEWSAFQFDNLDLLDTAQRNRATVLRKRISENAAGFGLFEFYFQKVA